MKFSLAGPIQYTLGRDWYTHGATAAAVVSFLDKSSLLAWWRLDTDVSTSGAEGLDSSGNGHVLTAPTDADRPSLDSGDVPSSRIQASSCLFDSNDVLESADSNSLSFGNGTTDQSFSISCWVKFTSLTNNQIIVGKSASGNNEYYLFKDAGTGTLTMYLMDNDSSGAAGRAAVTTTNTISADTWHHVAVTYDGSAGAAAGTSAFNGIKIYIDSVDRSNSYATGADYDAMHNTSANIGIGNLDEEVSNYGLNGNLADLALWSKELTSSTVSALYRAGSQAVFSNFRNWANKKSVATPGTRTSATYQGINIGSVVSASSDAFALGIIPFTHVEHKKVDVFRGTEKLFVNNFDDSVSFPEPANAGTANYSIDKQNEYNKIGSIKIIRHYGLPQISVRPGGSSPSGRYIIPDTARPIPQFGDPEMFRQRFLQFTPHTEMTTPVHGADSINFSYGIQGIEDGDVTGAAQRLYDAIYLAATTPNTDNPFLNLNVNYTPGTDTIYLSLKEGTQPSPTPVGGQSTLDIVGTAVFGYPAEENQPPTAVVTSLPNSLEKQVKYPLTDDRDFHGIMTQEKYTTRLRLDSPKSSFGLGQSSQYDDEGHFEDGNDFYATSYLSYSGSSAMWPINLSNAGSLIGRSYDGVLECFNIRDVITLDLDLRFDGRTIRGEVQGCYGSNFLGSTEIVSSEVISEKKHPPFLDAVDLFGFSDNDGLPNEKKFAHAQGTIEVTGISVGVFGRNGDTSEPPPEDGIGRIGIVIVDGFGNFILIKSNDNLTQGTVAQSNDPARRQPPGPNAGGKVVQFEFSTNSISTTAIFADLINKCIQEAIALGSIKVTSERVNSKITITQDRIGAIGNGDAAQNPRIYVTNKDLSTSNGGIIDIADFSGGLSPVGVMASAGAPAHVLLTRQRFPLDDKGNLIGSADSGVGRGLLFSDVPPKSSQRWLPGAIGGVSFLNMDMQKMDPYIERTYAQQFNQTLTVHNEDNSVTLDPLVSAVTNLSSSIYTTAPSAASGISKDGQFFSSPFAHRTFQLCRAGQITGDMPTAGGATGFYYSTKTDSIAFGDL